MVAEECSRAHPPIVTGSDIGPGLQSLVADALAQGNSSAPWAWLQRVEALPSWSPELRSVLNVLADNPGLVTRLAMLKRSDIVPPGSVAIDPGMWPGGDELQDNDGEDGPHTP